MKSGRIVPLLIVGSIVVSGGSLTEASRSHLRRRYLQEQRQKYVAAEDFERSSSLPPLLQDNLADVTAPLEPTDTPIFWHVPKCGGTTIEDFTGCLGLVQASQIGGHYGNDQDTSTELLVFEPWEGFQVVNVDTSTRSGRERAQSMGLAESGLADVVFTSSLHGIARIFSPDYKGRMFTLLRHPVERAISMFYYLQDATWEPTYSPETRGWTIEQYAKSSHIDRDWMTRRLIANFKTDLCQKDLELAKEILREKFLIGLMTKVEESVDRFDGYFGFDDGSGKVEECTQKMLDPGHGSNRHAHPKVDPDSNGWKMLAKVNYWDMQLYEYAVGLFEEQASLVNDIDEVS